MTPLERATHAIALYVPDQIAEETARAVIAAIREPSEAMKAAGGTDDDLGLQDAADRWHAMIDALLEEGK